MAARLGGPRRTAAAPRGALQAPSATELRLATRRAIAALRKTPRATAERALAAENDENEEYSPALEQLAMYHLRQIAAELEDEVREYLATGNVRDSGVVSFLLPSGPTTNDSDRSDALADLLESERIAAAQRSGALRALERPHTRARGSADAPRMNETYVVGGADVRTAPTSAIPRIADFEGIRDFSEAVSARDQYAGFRPPAAAAAAAADKRVVIIAEDDDDEGNPWSDDSVEEICVSARDAEGADAASVERVVKELRAELVADRSFVATFRSGDMAQTAREIQRRLRERSEARFEGGLDEEESRDQRSAIRDQRSPPPPRSARRIGLPLLESTPLKARPGLATTEQQPPQSSGRRSIVEEPPERVTIGVGTSDLPLHSTGVQCEPEVQEPSTSSSHHLHSSVTTTSRGEVVSSEETSSFGQVPERLLLLQQQQHVRIVQPTPPPDAAAAAAPDRAAAAPTPAPRTSAFRVRDATISSSASSGGVRLLSSPDSMIRGLLEGATMAPEQSPAPTPPPRMYPPDSDEEGEEENTLENLDSIRDS